MIRNPVAIAALILAITALAITFFRQSGSNPELDSIERELAILRQELSALKQQRTSLIDARPGREPEAAPPAAGARATGDSTTAAATTPELDLRIAELEAHAAEFDDLRIHLVDRGMLPPRPEDVAAAKQAVLDTAADPGDRLHALRLVRSAETEERSREIVLSMIELWETEPLPRVQADIFRQLEGVTVPELKEPLIISLGQSTSAYVREEAAETLAAYRDDPLVRQWLQFAAENDENGNVRVQALESLGNR